MERLLGALLQWGAHGGPHGPMGWESGGGMAPWGGAGGAGLGLLWQLLWVLLIAAIVIGAVYLSRNRTPADGPDRAMELLREQYARGEISDEEFEERSSRLSSN